MCMVKRRERERVCHLRYIEQLTACSILNSHYDYINCMYFYAMYTWSVYVIWVWKQKWTRSCSCSPTHPLYMNKYILCSTKRVVRKISNWFQFNQITFSTHTNHCFCFESISSCCLSVHTFLCCQHVPQVTCYTQKKKECVVYWSEWPRWLPST